MAKGEQDWREEAKERYKEKQQKGRFKLAEGENTIRILPRIGSKKSQAPFFEYNVHRDVGPNKRFVRCGKNLHEDGDCWLCDTKIPALQASGSTSKQKLAAALQKKEQFVVQVAAVDADSGKMRGPFLWNVSTGGARSLSARLLGVLKSTKRDYVDPLKGYNLTIERTGTGKTDTIYGQIVPDEDSSKVPDKILNAAKPFSAHVPAYSEEQQKAAYFGRDERSEDVEEEEERPVDEDEEETESEEEESDRPAKKKKKHVEEDEEEETTETEEEEEEEQPKKKTKKKSEEDEEEEPAEEEEPEEEEEERPKKKKKPADEDEEEPAEEPEEEEEPVSKKKKKKAVEEDEEEPEASEEEEEDERPAKKKGKKHVEEDEEEPAEEDEEEERPAKKKVKKSKHSDDDDE